MIIGLCGYAGAGKSEAAQYLTSAYGFERRHMGAPLKAMLKTGFGLTDDEIDGSGKEVPCDKLLGKTPRQAQIGLGMWARAEVGPDIWTEIFKRGVIRNARVVNESIRFPNEVRAIRSLGGVIIKISRGGTRPIAFRWGVLGKILYSVGIKCGAHPSERVDLIDADFVIDNPDGSVPRLRRALDEIMYELEPSFTEMQVAA